MPIYEYRCRACNCSFERMQKFSDPLVKKCPKCGKAKVEKLISRSAIKFEGTGWYVTDYARKAAHPSKASDKASGKESGAQDKAKGKKEKAPASGASSSGEKSKAKDKA